MSFFMHAVESKECRAIMKCSEVLEETFQSNSIIVYYLPKEGFITQKECKDECDGTLCASKNWVAEIRKKVSQNPSLFHKLVNHLSRFVIRHKGKTVSTLLQGEYEKQGNAKVCHVQVL